MLKRISLPILLVLAVIAAACGGPATTIAPTKAPQATEALPATTAPAATTAPQPAATQETITIVHWQHHFEARAKIVEELAKEFEAANPNIKIDFQSIPYNDYFQKIGPSLEAGTGPDVFQIPGSLVREFYDRGQLAPVPTEVYSTADIESDFLPWTIQLLKQGGQYVGLPTDVQSFVLFYNDDLFKDAGLDPSKDLETWDEFNEAAVKLTKREGDTLTQVGVDITASPYQWYWAMPLVVFDSGWVDEKTLKVTYDNPDGVAMWQFMTGLVTQHKVDSAEFLTGQNKFLLGKAAMNMHEYVFSGSITASAPNLNYSIHLPPRPAGRPKSTGGTHWAYVVSTQTKHPAEAWAWVKFLTSEDAQRKWVSGGGELPSRKALYDDPSLRSDPHVAAGLDSMQYTRPFDDFGWDDVYAIHQAIWDNIVLNGQDIAAAVHDGAVAEEKLYQDKKIKPSP